MGSSVSDQLSSISEELYSSYYDNFTSILFLGLRVEHRNVGLVERTDFGWDDSSVACLPACLRRSAAPSVLPWLRRLPGGSDFFDSVGPPSSARRRSVACRPHLSVNLINHQVPEKDHFAAVVQST